MVALLATPSRLGGRHKTGGRACMVLSLALSALVGCTGNPRAFNKGETPTVKNILQDQLQDQAHIASSSVGVRVKFQFQDFYSLASPNRQNSCAGDARTYYDPLKLTENQAPLKFPDDALNPSTTITPSFIKNVSVDLTDANTPSTLNAALSCSLGSDPSLPPPSSCATFDYGALGGLDASLGGGVLMVGGIEGSSTLGSSLYGVSIHALPPSAATNPPNAQVPGLLKADKPISFWNDLSSTPTYAGPVQVVGAASAFSASQRKLLLFGGSIPSGTSWNSSSRDTWSLEVGTQTWSLVKTAINVDASITTVHDKANATAVFQFSKNPGARAGFGYVAAQGFALEGLAGDFDKTDRLMIVGGVTPNTINDSNAATSSTNPSLLYRFNPTYGPELVDAHNATNATLGFWVDNYHTQVMSNISKTDSQLLFGNYPLSEMGFFALRQETTKRGYLLSSGGFKLPAKTLDKTLDAPIFLEPKEVSPNRDFLAGSKDIPSDLLSVSNWLLDYLVLSPAVWHVAAPLNNMLWFGGVSAQRGFSLVDNEILYFGGTYCRGYWFSDCAAVTGATTPATGQKPTVQTNTGAYVKLGADLSGTGARTLDNGPPVAAGLASARGLDPAGKVIIVAWGGVLDDFKTALANDLYYLHNTSGSKATWVKVQAEGADLLPIAGQGQAYSNSALVFSHVTHKFYLFGGFSKESKKVLDSTWELSVSGGACTADAKTTPCKFAWKKLTAENGLTCSPQCPSARFLHRMAEVNYYNRDAAKEPDCTKSNEPCSFGIFMEGGTDMNLFLSDRWMYDPVAHYDPVGKSWVGHWQKMDELPPRVFGSMAAVDLKIASTGKTYPRAVMFGGETGMRTAGLVPMTALVAPSGVLEYFVAPTLGDTWIYDFEKESWNRAKLQGGGKVTDPINEHFPPPLSGAVMITRDFKGAKVPEVFLFGGRTKDGTFAPLSKVYKFCLGSESENPSAPYDCLDPQYVTEPTAKYEGRWFAKAPFAAVARGAFLGAGTYDSTHDLLLLTGGLYGDKVALSNVGKLQAGSEVLEYTPPNKQHSGGAWRVVAPCGVVPPERFGHSMHYDAVQDRVFLVGGTSPTGTPLSQTIVGSDSKDLSIPDMWVGKRTGAVEDGTLCYDWEQVSTFGNAFGLSGEKNPPAALSFAASIYLPSSGYNTGYYTLTDSACAKAGPILSPDFEVNKTLAGGAYLDIDRSALGPSENLVLHLKYIPQGPPGQKVDKTAMSAVDASYFKIHLVKTNQTQSALQQVQQPRYLAYTSLNRYPQVVQTLSVLAPADNQIHEDQIVIPLAIDPEIDRIRIERVSGSAVLLEAAVYRMGNRGQP
ncbi:hypothetical protein WDW37_19490 [Bdellovibrionota bacterium FG-1]